MRAMRRRGVFGRQAPRLLAPSWGNMKVALWAQEKQATVVPLTLQNTESELEAGDG